MPTKSDKENCILTIAIPTCNRSKRLEQRLIELMDQYKDNFIVLVSDNGSTDGTPELTKDYMQKMPYLRYHRYERNMGLDRNVLKLYELAETEYIWYTSDAYQIQKNSAAEIIKFVSENEPTVVFFGHKSADGAWNNQDHQSRCYNALDEIEDYNFFFNAVMLSKLVVRNLPQLDMTRIKQYDGTWHLQVTIALELLAIRFRVCYAPSIIVTQREVNHITTAEYLRICLIGPLKAVNLPHLNYEFKEFQDVKASEWKSFMWVLLYAKLGMYRLNPRISLRTAREAYRLLGYRVGLYFLVTLILYMIPSGLLKRVYYRRQIQKHGLEKGRRIYQDITTRAERQKKFSSY